MVKITGDSIADDIAVDFLHQSSDLRLRRIGFLDSTHGFQISKRHFAHFHI